MGRDIDKTQHHNHKSHPNLQIQGKTSPEHLNAFHLIILGTLKGHLQGYWLQTWII